MGNDLVLASTSVYRRTLLARLGLPFRCLAPRVDEEAAKAGDWEPQELAEHLALAKARSLCEAEPNATLIGSDQLVSFAGRIYGKPGTTEGAVEQLLAMAGKSHQLITALAVWTQGQTYVHTDITTMHMRSLSRVELERYVAADHPLDCAGSYKLEERGISLFDRVETQDYTSIMGLPLIALTSLLRTLGYPIP
ncbi:Maf family protein [Singulisphaera acidiphila]|uniref:7-methyl-GTP pyrophosphatase n=1 Tax=Singulisphaera acidiphila (strain ATCC BAA-1392 / DSM 18658 / VKM B-2454 / MOB10) TaxID=886293 RepID=L0DC01_SINAD|nr:nucleoside triphosphate pyrophosphatase [Singulisphaera acidiphila]AGA26899.1 MAF protein [Singulisphaera acidiphila DSM 18658]